MQQTLLDSLCLQNNFAPSIYFLEQHCDLVVMATSGKPTHSAQMAALLATVVTVALFAGTSTADLIDLSQPPVSVVSVIVANTLKQPITYTVITDLAGLVKSSTSEFIEPGESKEVKVDPWGEAGVGFNVTITVGNYVYDDNGIGDLINTESRTVAQIGILKRNILSCPSPFDNETGLFVSTYNPTSVGNHAECTGPRRPKSR